MATDNSSPDAFAREAAGRVRPVDCNAPPALGPDACRDEVSLRKFIGENISVNAWPIHAGQLRKLILRQGLDVAASRRFTMPLSEMERMMERFQRRSLRVERMLGIDNAFHRTLHNYEVLLRLLLLEWPVDHALPDDIRQAPRRIYSGLESIGPVILHVIRSLIERGVPLWAIARDLLAGLGHDYGHSGGTDRLDRHGLPAPYTHEQVAEKHAAKLGIEHGFPPALILESMAGIRATTFYSRRGWEKVQPVNDFERKLTLADVMGCVLPAAEWLVHVGAPVLHEKTPMWNRRLVEIPEQLARLSEQMHVLPSGDPSRHQKEEEQQELVTEKARIVKHLEEWFLSERGFFLFVQSYKLAAVPGASALWGDILQRKVALMERVLGRPDLLSPLVALGFPFLEDTARVLCQTGNLSELAGDERLDPRLREVLSLFLEDPD
jgi:hypothetical protein